MKENSLRDQGDNPRRWGWKKRRQMPGKEKAGGDSLPQEIIVKEVCGEEGGSEKTGTTLEQRHPTWPEVEVVLFLSGHVTAKDMEGMKPHMQNADIYFCEDPDGGANVRIFGDISDIDPHILPPSELEKFVETATIGRDNRPLKGSPIETIARSLYATNVKVEHCDLIPGDPVTSREIGAQLNSPYLASNFTQTLDNLGRNIERLAQSQTQREEIITDRLEERLETLLEQHPELADKSQKPKLKVLMTMGSIHTSLGHKLRDAGILARDEFPQKPYLFGHWAQAERVYLFGKEPSHDLLAKAHLENMIISSWDSSKLEKFDTFAEYLRAIASQFSTEEIAAVHQDYLSAQQTGDYSFVDRLIVEKGLGEFPQDQKETEEAIEKMKQQEKAAAEQRLEEYRLAGKRT